VSKRFKWEQPIVPVKPMSTLDLYGKIVPSPEPSRIRHDVKELRKQVKTLQKNSEKKGAKE
jgi:hypothetical protein